MFICAAVTDETPITQAEFDKVRHLPDAKRSEQTFRRKCPQDKRTMTPERWDSNQADEGVIKYTCPAGHEFFFKADLTGVDGLGIVQPGKVQENEEHKDPKHPVWINPNIGLQYKYNGMRLTAYIKGPTADWSVRHTNVDGGLATKRAVLSYIHFPPDLKGTIIDCEAHAEKFWRKVPGSATPLQAVIRILNVNDVDAQKRLREWGYPEIRVFDCLAYKGKKVKDLPYAERLALAAKVVEEVGSQYVQLTKTITDNKFQHYKDILDKDGEGAILVDLTKGYDDNNNKFKVKKSTTFDCYIIGFVPGLGKYAGQVGGFKFGTTLPNGKKVYVCNANVGSDKDRKWATENQEKLLGKVYELTFQEWSTRSPQHPRFVEGINHPRADKSPENAITEEGMVPERIWKYWTGPAPAVTKFTTLHEDTTSAVLASFIADEFP